MVAIKKHKILLTLVIIITIIYFQKEKDLKIDPENFMVTDSIIDTRRLLPKEELTCNPKKFVFLKVHKAGSSTMRQFFYNYATDNNFEMNLSRMGPWVGGYPGPFLSDFHDNDDYTDVIFDHLRWNKQEIFKTLSHPKNHLTIAIMRRPMDQFKSSFNYFYGQYKGLDGLGRLRNKRTDESKACVGEPYLTLTGSTDFSLEQYINKLRLNPATLSSSPWYFRVNNSQSFDFNHPENLDDFDLVMVLERMQESLVLLKEMLCAKWEQITPFAGKINAKNYDSSTSWIDEKDGKFVEEELLNLDNKLYAEAVRKLEQQIEIYGRDKMKATIEEKFMFEQKPKKRSIPKWYFKEAVMQKVTKYMEENNAACSAVLD